MADAESTGDRNAEEACPDGRGAAAIGRGVAWAERTDGRTNAIRHPSFAMRRKSTLPWRITAQFYHAEER
jgi:hypothetical protein